jgi:hypothetical protein
MNQSQALDDTSAVLALIDPWLRAHLPALDAAVTRRVAQLVTGIFEQRSLLLSTIAESTTIGLIEAPRPYGTLLIVSPCRDQAVLGCPCPYGHHPPRTHQIPRLGGARRYKASALPYIGALS